MSCQFCNGPPGSIVRIGPSEFGWYMTCSNCGDPVMNNSTQEKRLMMHEFPYHTLANLQVMVSRLDTEKERYMKLVNDIALYSEIFAAKVSSWALETRLGGSDEKV
jgi:hypothetical protein